MYRGNSRRLFPILLVAIIMIIAIVALVSAGRALFGGKPSANQTASTQDQAQANLLDTATNRGVRVTVRGAIVAQENFRSYQIVVTPATRAMTVYKGYLGDVLDSKQYTNNIKAYDEFVHALDKANFTKGESTKDKEDTRGICASGTVYEYDLLDGTNSTKRLWTSTCSGSKGTFQASVDQVQGLFSKQIPDYASLTKGMVLSGSQNRLF